MPEQPNNNNVVQRVVLSLLPLAVAAVFGQGVYVLVWGVKIDARVAALEAVAAENRAKVDIVQSTGQQRFHDVNNRAASLEEMINSTQARIDTLIALMKVRERSDSEYQRRPPDRPPDYRLQSESPNSSPP